MNPTKAAAPGPALITPNPKLKLLDQIREVARLKHFSLRTEQAYLGWAKRFLLFHKKLAGGWRHPRELASADVVAFLSDLAVVSKVSAATQNQAMNALVFLYREVLHLPLEGLADRVRVQRPARLPTVLSKTEVQRLLKSMEGTAQGCDCN
jgi:integrase